MKSDINKPVKQIKLAVYVGDELAGFDFDDSYHYDGIEYDKTRKPEQACCLCG